MSSVNASLALLEREVYSEAEAARLLGLPQGTLHYWLEGGVRRGTTYLPVIRTEPTGRRTVTWGEFVEAGLLREYRKVNIPMDQLRAFITYLRDKLGIAFPLAHERPYYTGGAGLVREAQEAAGLAPTFWLWNTGQGLLTYAGKSFVERVTWEADVVGSYRPHDDPRSPVIVDPRIRFGRPSVGGISTLALFEQSESGASAEEIAATYGLPPTTYVGRSRTRALARHDPCTACGGPILRRCGPAWARQGDRRTPPRHHLPGRSGGLHPQEAATRVPHHGARDP